MGYVPPHSLHSSRNLDTILGKERGMIFSELAATIWQISQTGRYPMIDFTPIPCQVDTLNVTNDQGMEFSLEYEET